MADKKDFVEDFYNDKESDAEEMELDSSYSPQNINIICEENCKILVRKNKKGCSIEIRCDCDYDECECECECECDCDCECKCNCDCEYEN